MTLLFSLMLMTLGSQTPNDHPPGVFAVQSVPAAQQSTITPSRLRAMLLDKGNRSDLSSIWKKLGIRPTEFTDCSLCEAELKFAESDMRGPAVIRFEDIIPRYTRFLVLEQFRDGSAAAWRLTGYIDLLDQFEPPDYSVIKTSSDVWLTIDVWKDHGTAISSFSRNWFEIENGISQILDAPASGYQGTGWLSIVGERSVTSHVLSLVKDDSEELLAISFSAEFTDENRRPLFKIARNVVYSRSGSAPFQYDSKRSGVTSRELDILFNTLRGFSVEDFLQTCFEPLKAIADSADARKRRWLRQLLQGERRPSPEKTLLVEMLSRKK